jgi:hypothetical protein
MDRRNTTAVALLAALFGALAVAAPVAIRSSAPEHGTTQAALASVSGSQRLSEWQKRPFKVLNDFLGFTDEDAYNKWDTADDPRASYTIDFLIATLPEPLAPSLRYKFDTYLDAIQRAAEASDLIFDRLDLPWGDPSKDDSPGFRLGQEIDLGWEPNIGGESSAFASLKPSTKKQATSQDEAGILLFRSRAAGNHRLLLVFVVGETPTWGVRKQALTDSLNWIEWLSNLWDEPSLPQRFPPRAEIRDRSRLKSWARHSAARQNQSTSPSKVGLHPIRKSSSRR